MTKFRLLTFFKQQYGLPTHLRGAFARRTPRFIERIRFPGHALAKNVIRNVSVDVSQAEVAAGIAVGELCVVKAEQVQVCGVEIVDVELVVDAEIPNSSVAP